MTAIHAAASGTAGDDEIVDRSGDFWYPVALSSEVKDAPVAVELLGRRVVVYRQPDGTPVALHDLCVHRGTPLSLGRVDGDVLVCAYHGWSYGPDGICTRIPQRPKSAIPTKARVDSYAVEEAYGVIWLCLGTPLTPLTPFPEYADSAYGTVFVGTQEWKANAARLLENFLDVGHFAWVHPGLLGDPRQPEVDVGPVTHLDAGFEYTAKSPIPGPDGEWITETLLYRLSLPFWFTVTHVDGHTPTESRAGDAHSATTDHVGHRYRVDIAVQPLARRASRSYTWISRNYDTDSMDDAVEFQLHVASQDRPIVENQRPEELPLDLADEMHLRNVDAPAVEFRRLLRRISLLEGTD
jgi:vanillate O-demethylase monooxygenase subunit